MTQYAKKVVFSTVFVFIMLFLTGVFNYIFRIVLAKNLELVEYGLFFSVLSFFTLIGTLLDMGLQFSAVKFISEARAKKKNVNEKRIILSVFLFQITLSVVVSLVIFSLEGYLSSHFFKADASGLIKLMLVWFVSLPFFFFFNYVFLGNQKPVAYSSVDTTRAATITILSILFLHFGLGILSPAFAYVVSVLFLLVIYSPLFLRIYPDFFRKSSLLGKKYFLKILKYGVMIAIGISSYVIILQTDTLMITYFRTLKEVGLYQAAVPIALIIIFFAQATATVLYPLSSELWVKKKKHLLSMGINMIYKYFFIFIFPMAAILFSFPKLVLTLLFGPEFVGAATVLKVFAFGAILLSFYLMNQAVLQGIGKPKVIAKIIIFAALFNVIINFILIPIYGMMGAVTATILSYLVAFVLASFQMRKVFGIKVPLSIWGRTIIAGVLFIVLIHFMKQWISLSSLAEFFVVLPISFIFYIVLIWLMRVISLSEIKQLVRLVFPKK